MDQTGTFRKPSKGRGNVPKNMTYTYAETGFRLPKKPRQKPRHGGAVQLLAAPVPSTLPTTAQADLSLSLSLVSVIIRGEIGLGHCFIHQWGVNGA